MNIRLKILSFQTTDAIADTWKLGDYQTLLERLDVDGFESMTFTEAEEMLFMALTDKKPEDAATVLLDYKFSKRLRAGQIEQMSHEILEDCLPEEHADISLHYELFNINELLNRAFSNQFPDAKATHIRFRLKCDSTPSTSPSKEVILKAFAQCFTDGQIITRLYEDQLSGQVPFPEADYILWDVTEHGEHEYTAITSRYWLEREDFATLAADKPIELHKPKKEKD